MGMKFTKYNAQVQIFAKQKRRFLTEFIEVRLLTPKVQVSKCSRY